MTILDMTGADSFATRVARLIPAAVDHALASQRDRKPVDLWPGDIYRRLADRHDLADEQWRTAAARAAGIATVLVDDQR